MFFPVSTGQKEACAESCAEDGSGGSERRVPLGGGRRRPSRRWHSSSRSARSRTRLAYAHRRAVAQLAGIDGGIKPANEWADAASLQIPFPGHPATLTVKHKDAFLYALLTVQDDRPAGGIQCCSATIFFDNNHNGVRDPGEDAMGFGPGNQAQRPVLRLDAGTGFHSTATIAWPAEPRTRSTARLVRRCDGSA